MSLSTSEDGRGNKFTTLVSALTVNVGLTGVFLVPQDQNAVELPRIVRGCLNLIGDAAQALKPSHGTNYTQMRAGVLKDFEQPYKAMQWVQRAHDMLDSVRRLVRLYVWCDQELDRLKVTERLRSTSVRELSMRLP